MTQIRFRALWTAPVIAIVLFGSHLAYKSMRENVLGGTQSPSALSHWWASVILLYFFLFLCVSGTVLTVLRRVHTNRAMLESIANAFVFCFLFALASITGDPAVLPSISALGLASLHQWLFGAASVWVLVWLYFLLEPGGIRRPQ